MIETIVLDIGETLVRDDRYWASWADWIGVPRHTLAALVGAVVTQGRDSADALRMLKPGMDVRQAHLARETAGRGEHLDETDLYEDVRPALGGLRKLGIRVIVAGNQTVRAGELLRGLDLPADLVATSDEWGVDKPQPGFYERVLEVAGSAPHETVYVGDHPVNDVFPAKAAGLRVAHLRRGPWGHWWADDPEVVAAADWRIDSLTQLASIVAEETSGAHSPGV
ncbi:HAD family hydrolase [Streptomyces sp. NPDC056670]|uniref:HAD family hydrolase n=1 Tax=Streptomyces sp. NPDC056670 TaxID=3345904 RepID=UPI0036A1D312